MKRHMTDEGWQLFQGLEYAGFRLVGKDLYYEFTNVEDVISQGLPPQGLPINTVVMQDKREWEGLTADRSQDPRMRFTSVQALAQRPDIFKLTILKDAHQNPEYHRQSAAEIDCHAWIVYYHPDIIHRLAPWTRPRHLVRTWHSIDSDLVPDSTYENRHGTLLSGAVSSAYPLRSNLFNGRSFLPETTVLPHPGYHRKGCATPQFLKTLSQFKVAICTSSIYGYTLRKIVEATACGCIVLTDLPSDEVMPGGIDENLVRITPDFTAKRIGHILRELYDSYNPERQRRFVEAAKLWYDYRAVGQRLANDIETLRLTYNKVSK